MGEMWLEGAAGVLRLDGEARLWWKPHHGDEREHIYDAGPATFARLPRLDQVARADIAVLGIPFDSGVSYPPGARFGPAAIRA